MHSIAPQIFSRDLEYYDMVIHRGIHRRARFRLPFANKNHSYFMIFKKSKAPANGAIDCAKQCPRCNREMKVSPAVTQVWLQLPWYEKLCDICVSEVGL